MRDVKKINILMLMFITVFLLTISFSEVYATSGKLKSSSIIECGGNYYGNHGDGHWHYAVNRSSGWYPSGASLGYENPCGGYINQFKQQEEDRAAAAKAEADRLEQIRLEEENKEKIRKETEERLNDTTLKFVSISGNKVSSSNSTNIFISEMDDVRIELGNGQAISKVSLLNDSKPFSDNSVVVKVISENNLKSADYKMPVYILGSNQDLLELDDVTIMFNNKEYALNNGIIVIEDEINVDSFNGIYIDGIQRLTNSTATLDTVEEEGMSHVLTLKIKDAEYRLPILIKQEENEEGTILLGALGTVSVFGAGGLLFHQKKKTKITKKRRRFSFKH